MIYYMNSVFETQTGSFPLKIPGHIYEDFVLLKASDIFSFPFRFKENYPLTNLSFHRQSVLRRVRRTVDHRQLSSAIL